MDFILRIVYAYTKTGVVIMKRDYESGKVEYGAKLKSSDIGDVCDDD